MAAMTRGTLMHPCQVPTPAGMRRVSKVEFFDLVGPRDVTPYSGQPEYTTWETSDRVVIGRSYPGWRNPGDPKVYFLVTP